MSISGINLVRTSPNMLDNQEHSDSSNTLELPDLTERSFQDSPTIQSNPFMPTPLLQEGEFERTIRISYALQKETVAEEQGHRDESSSAHKSGRRNPEDELTRSNI